MAGDASLLCDGFLVKSYTTPLPFTNTLLPFAFDMFYVRL